MHVASMPAFLGAAGHAEGLMHVVTRHDPLEKKAFSVFSQNFGMGKMEQKSSKGRVENWVVCSEKILSNCATTLAISGRPRVPTRAGHPVLPRCPALLAR